MLLGGCEGIKASITDGDRISSFHQTPTKLPPNPQQIIDKGMLHSLLSARVSVKQESVLAIMERSTKACLAAPPHPTPPPYHPLVPVTVKCKARAAQKARLTGGIIEKKGTMWYQTDIRL